MWKTSHNYSEENWEIFIFYFQNEKDILKYD